MGGEDARCWRDGPFAHRHPRSERAPLLPLEVVAQAAASADRDANAALARIGDQWRTGYASMLLDLAEFNRSSGERTLRFLERQTGQRFGRDFDRWHRWIWSLPYDPHPDNVSNKLMFDEQTNSLWSTLEGKPVVGPLAGKRLELRPRPIVTTTWAEWRLRHPATTVLSLDTGHERDYGEGAAYRDYFATDRLMFGVPSTDRRLKNKDEVLVLRPPAGTPGAAHTPAAIAVDLLNRQPIFHARAGGQSFVVITTRGGANRAYDSGDRRFSAGGGSDRLTDDRGKTWTITEDALVADGERAPRLAAQRAFWFGWHAQFPETVLIK